MNIIIDKKYKWEHVLEPSIEYWYIGSEKAVKDFILFLNKNQKSSLNEIKQKIYNLKGNFGIIVKQKDRIIAVVDKIRSYPVFYYHDGDKFAVSNSARALKNEFSLTEIDDLSLLEFRMAGYVTGRETLYKNLYQLQAGEVILWDINEKKLMRNRYYIFYSEKLRKEKEDDLIQEFDTITNEIFLRIINEANGLPIWVPLSGGLDSRLVLCKLKQLGYDNLTAFSYGVKGNYETKVAKIICAKVRVPWYFVPITMKESKKFFYSEIRKDYWQYSDGLYTIPNIQDIHPLIKLKKNKIIPDNAIIINGQSGDFITGGHIPSLFISNKPEIKILLKWAIEKHYSQWHNLKTKANLKKIKGKILQLINLNKSDNFQIQRLVSLYEWWEWQERQCKYVINGQRIYDYLGLKWFLPLWDHDYLIFWDKIGFSYKYRQKLYKKYLIKYNFFNVFKNFNHEIWRWPGISIAVVPIARLLKLIFGSNFSDRFYHYFKYIGHYRDKYAPYNLLDYIKKAHKIRGPISLNIETWIKENLNKDISKGY